MLKEINYYVMNLKEVNIEKKHPYTLIFKGYVPVFGGNKLYTFKYDGDVVTDCSMSEKIKYNFKKQLSEDYGCGIMFDIKDVRRKLEVKSQYRIEM